MFDDQNEKPSRGFWDTFWWINILRPCLLAFIFQYAYMAYYLGLRIAMVLAIIDGGVLLFMDLSSSQYLTTWLIKCAIQWPILGVLGANGSLDWLNRVERPQKDRIIDAVMMGGLIAVVSANLIILIHRIGIL